MVSYKALNTILEFLYLAKIHIFLEAQLFLQGDKIEKNFCITTLDVPRNGNYSGGFLLANCAGKKCTARCSQRVAQRFSDVCTLWSSYQWANISAEPHVASNVRYIAFSMRTNTLLTPSKARYISYLGHTPNTAEPHAFKQGVVHCLVTTSDVPRNVKSKLFSRENF